MEKLDKERYLKRVIVVCWIALAICFAIKLFGGNLFEIMCENENFIRVCNYADNHFWADYLISLSYSYVSNYFAILAMCGKWKFSKKELIIFSTTVASTCAIKILIPQSGMVLDLWQGIIMPCLFTLKNPKRHKWVLIGNALLIAFQLISMFIRNLSFNVVSEDGLVIGIIYCIDITIMIFLYYLYSNFKLQRKEK